MSSITLIKVRLRNISAELLRQVVEQLCKEYGGQMTTTITDYAGNTAKVGLGFKCQAFQRGVGFVIQKGEVFVKGDFFNFYEFQHQVQRQLTQNYTAMAHSQALRQQGFQVQQQKVGSKIVLRAFAW
jgi:hypothetical protein